MWFFLIKAITGAIIGDASAEWFKKTKVGLWFYKKVERLYNWAAKRYNIKIATVEEKLGSLVAVTSPFDGKIRKINYESQNNNYILGTAFLDTTEATTMSEFVPRMPEIVARISYGKF